MEISIERRFHYKPYVYDRVRIREPLRQHSSTGITVREEYGFDAHKLCPLLLVLVENKLAHDVQFDFVIY